METPILSMDQALFYASLYHFLPHIAAKQHGVIYTQVQLMQRRTASEFLQPSPLSIESLYQTFLSETSVNVLPPGIFATFHTGSYRLISLLLVRMNRPVAIILSKAVIDREKELLLATKERMQAGADPQAPLHLLQAEDPHSLRKALSLLKSGCHLLIYADGGAGAQTQVDQGAKIDFLKGKLRLRKGIAYLSYWSGAPVYPLITIRTTGGREEHALKQDHPIRVHSGESREAYAQRCMQSLFSFLGEVVERHPEQWEAWHYIHESVCLEGASKTSPEDISALIRTLNPDQAMGRLQVYKKDSELFLLDALSFKSYRLTK